MGLKERINQRVISPSLEFNSDRFDIIAVVKKSNTKTNRCDVTMYSENGQMMRKKDLPIRYGTSSTIDWFPEEDEIVYVNFVNNRYYVAGPSDDAISGSQRANAELKNDIYSDMTSNDTQGGFIF